MKNNVFLGVLGFSVLAVLVGMYVSTTMQGRPNLGFPWQIELLPDGSTKIFQVHLGQTSLGEAEQLFQEPFDLTMFVPKGKPPVIEAYFNELYIGGFKAKMVVSFDLTEEQTQPIYDRGVRVSTLGSGTRKVTLHDDDIARVRTEKIVGITYLPSIQLDAEMIENRFGTPSQKITDAVSGAEHWLYPDKGLDVTLSDNAKEVLQYVLPTNFNKLTQPLVEAANTQK